MLQKHQPNTQQNLCLATREHVLIQIKKYACTLTEEKEIQANSSSSFKNVPNDVLDCQTWCTEIPKAEQTVYVTPESRYLQRT